MRAGAYVRGPAVTFINYPRGVCCPELAPISRKRLKRIETALRAGEDATGSSSCGGSLRECALTVCDCCSRPSKLKNNFLSSFVVCKISLGKA